MCVHLTWIQNCNSECQILVGLFLPSNKKNAIYKYFTVLKSQKKQLWLLLDMILVTFIDLFFTKIVIDYFVL